MNPEHDAAPQPGQDSGADANQNNCTPEVPPGVTPAAWAAIGAKSEGPNWVIPERNGRGEVIGWAIRRPNGQKDCKPGGKRGLILSWPQPSYAGTSEDEPILITEGASDTAAAIGLGFDAVGVPMAGYGVELLGELLAGQHLVIFGDADDAGRKGAEAIAAKLVGAAATVRVIYPPDGFKDLREWVTIGKALKGDVCALIGKAEARSAAAPETAVNEPWAAPLPLYGRVSPFPIADAFPPGAEAVRDLCSEVGEAFQVPVDLPAMLVPPVIGLALSHRVRVRLGPEWLQPPNHYHACLMEPGNRKTGPFQVLTGPIEAWEKQEAERLGPMIAADSARMDVMRRKLGRLKDLASGKGRPKKDEPAGYEAEKEAIELEKKLAAEKPVTAPQLLTSDVTTEELGRLMASNGERAGIMSDEGEAIEVFLGRYDGKPNLQLYNKGYDGSTHRVNRINRPPVILDHPLISIGFVIQPEAVRDMLTNQKAKGTGLVARFGMSLPVSLLGGRSVDAPPLPTKLRGLWRSGLLDLLNGELDATRGPAEVLLSAKAQGAFREFQVRIERELSWTGEFAQHGIQDWGGKFCGRIGRMALTLHGARRLCGSGSLIEPISEQTMIAAIAWAPYLIDHAKAVMGWLGRTTGTAGAKRILAWVARRSLDAFTRQECFTGVRCAQVEAAADVDAPLSLLSDLGYLRPVPAPVVSGPGRKPSPRFLVNPKWDRRTV